MKTILALFFCQLALLQITYAQVKEKDTSWVTNQVTSDAEFERLFKSGLDRNKLKLNQPIAFNEISFSKINRSKFVSLTRNGQHQIKSFYKYLVNLDTSVLIALKTDYTTRIDIKKNSIIGFKFWVDSVGNDYHYLDKDWLKKFNTDFGVEYSAKKALPFMNRFPNHRIVHIAG